MAKIFIASSFESREYAEDAYHALEELKATPMLWMDPAAFAAGLTNIENFETRAAGNEAALFIVTPDTVNAARGLFTQSPRDNILFELGYYMGRYGRRSVMMVCIDHVQLPSDIDGIVYRAIDPPQRDASGDYDHFKFKMEVKKRVQSWVAGLKNPLPQLAETLVKQLVKLQSLPNWGVQFETVAYDLLTQLADSMGERADPQGRPPWGGIADHKLIDKIATLSLPSAHGIYAIDVMGPAGWLDPAAFRYLSVQIREYVKRNIHDSTWRISVTPRVADAIQRALKHTSPKLSKTNFDPSEVDWHRSTEVPLRGLEFCRVLLWTETELRSEVGRSVVDIHTAFNVPLFWLKSAGRDEPARNMDYILFAQASGQDGKGRVVAGFYGMRADGYKTDVVPSNGWVEGIEKPLIEHFWSLLDRNELIFAADALDTNRPGNGQVVERPSPRR